MEGIDWKQRLDIERFKGEKMMVGVKVKKGMNEKRR